LDLFRLKIKLFNVESILSFILGQIDNIHRIKPNYSLMILILILWNLVAYPWDFVSNGIINDEITNIISGNMVILIYWLISPRLYHKVNAAYEDVLANLVDKSKFDEYAEESDRLMIKIFKEKEILHKIRKLVIFFTLMGSIALTYTILNIGQGDVNVGSNGAPQDFADNFAQMQDYGRMQLFAFLIVYLLNMLGQIYIMYLLTASIYYSFGTSLMFHHFTFWETDEQPNKTSNPLGEGVILNYFFLIIQLSAAIYNTFGFILCLLVYILSPLNPIKNYSDGISRNYQKLFKAIPTILFLKYLSQIILFFSNGDDLLSFSMFNLFTDAIMIIAFSLFLTKKITGSTKIEEINNFSVNLAYRSIFPNDLRKSDKIITLITIIAPISAISFLLAIILIDGEITNQLYMLLGGSLLISTIIQLLTNRLRKIQNTTKLIGETLYNYNRQDKKAELKFHYWETFSSQELIVFSIPFVIIFIAIGWSLLINITFTSFYLEFLYFALIIIPLVLSLGFIGFLFASLLWIMYHAPHFTWHAISLIKMDNVEREELIAKFNISETYKQENDIYTTYLMSLFLFITFFVILSQITLINIIPMMIFNIILFLIFNIKIRSIFKKTYEAIF
jgi:hypothetical protein